jgi:hypothetical protein
MCVTLTFNDRHILSLVQTGDEMQITVEGSSGKHYLVSFEGVSSVESESPERMMLHALNEASGESELLWRYEFVNWYVNEP